MFSVNSLSSSRQINALLIKLVINSSAYSNDLDSIKSVVDKIFGIHTYHIAYKVESDSDVIQKEILNIISKESFNTFKIETKRSNKSFPIHSQDFNRVLAGVLLKNIPNISKSRRNRIKSNRSRHGNSL